MIKGQYNYHDRHTDGSSLVPVLSPVYGDLLSHFPKNTNSLSAKLCHVELSHNRAAFIQIIRNFLSPQMQTVVVLH